LDSADASTLLFWLENLSIQGAQFPALATLAVFLPWWKIFEFNIPRLNVTTVRMRKGLAALLGSPLNLLSDSSEVEKQSAQMKYFGGAPSNHNISLPLENWHRHSSVKDNAAKLLRSGAARDC
jgi:hypothetical protein